MKTWKIATAVVALVLLASVATFATALACGWWNTPYNQQVAYGYGNTATSQVPAPVTVTNTTTPTLYTPQFTTSTGTSTGYGWGGCMGGQWGWGTNGVQTTTTTVTITQATDIAKTYVASLNNADLKVTQVEEYQNNFYVAVGEKSTDNGAFQLLINKATGVITPEMGPNMMWNTKYTFGNGWCNWYRGTTTATPTVTADQAKTDAQQYLNTYVAGTTTGDITAFPGYYNIEVQSNGTPYGMLSVNAFTGQVWFHTWHGAFIQEQAVA